MATRIEADPFLTGLNLHKITSSPIPAYKNSDFLLIVSGIGKCNAAIAATYSICSHDTHRIFNLGAAGSTTDRFRVGQIVHINKVLEQDRPHLLNNKERTFEPGLLEGYPMATLATQDIPVTSPEARASLSHAADLVDMEGAAVVQACQKMHVPVYLFKIVTDTPAHDRDIEIIENVKKTRQVLFDFFLKNLMDR